MEGKWHLWGSDWAHGDSLLFAVSSAQVMYAYVMRPDTLPPAYLKFITDTGPIPRAVLAAVKSNNRGLPVDLDRLKSVYQTLAPKGVALARPLEGILAKLATDAYGAGASPLVPPMLPCAILHPHNPSCSAQWVETWLNAAKRSLPVYLSLTFVPMFVLRFWMLIKHPIDQLQRGLWSVTKSTSFLASFVSIYMMIVCSHRHTFVRDHRSLYWVAGFIASWTILLEQKSRRSELALYVLPRAIDSFVQALQSRKFIANVPHGEKILFCAGMAALMHYREHTPEAMSPLLRRLLNFFVPTHHNLPRDAPTVDPALAQNALARGESDGLSSPSLQGVIPLPQAGISYSREQSFRLPHSAAASGGALGASVSYGLFPRDRDLSPTSDDILGEPDEQTEEVSPSVASVENVSEAVTPTAEDEATTSNGVAHVDESVQTQALEPEPVPEPSSTVTPAQPATTPDTAIVSEPVSESEQTQSQSIVVESESVPTAVPTPVDSAVAAAAAQPDSQPAPTAECNGQQATEETADTDVVVAAPVVPVSDNAAGGNSNSNGGGHGKKKKKKGKK